MLAWFDHLGRNGLFLLLNLEPSLYSLNLWCDIYHKRLFVSPVEKIIDYQYIHIN